MSGIARFATMASLAKQPSRTLSAHVRAVSRSRAARAPGARACCGPSRHRPYGEIATSRFTRGEQW